MDAASALSTWDTVLSPLWLDPERYHADGKFHPGHNQGSGALLGRSCFLPHEAPGEVEFGRSSSKP